MHVGWLITVPRIEKESVRANTQDGRHNYGFFLEFETSNPTLLLTYVVTRRGNVVNRVNQVEEVINLLVTREHAVHPHWSKMRKDFSCCPGPKRSRHRRVPRPIICQNLT